MDNIYKNYDIPKFQLIPSPIHLNKNIYYNFNKKDIDIRDIYENEIFTNRTFHTKTFHPNGIIILVLLLFIILLFTKS